MWVTRKGQAIVTSCLIVARTMCSTCAFSSINIRLKSSGRSVVIEEEGEVNRWHQIQRLQKGVSLSASDPSKKRKSSNNNIKKRNMFPGEPPLTFNTLRTNESPTTPMLESWSCYFSNPSIRRKSIGPPNAPLNASIPTKATEWRTQASLTASRLSTFGNRGCGFSQHSPRRTDGVPIADPSVHHPSINAAIAALETATRNVATSAFLPETGQGGLRHVRLQVERSTGKVSLVLVWNADSLKRCQPGLTRLVKELRKIEPQLWANVWLHTNDSLGNSIFARGEQRWHRLVGPEYIRESIPTPQNTNYQDQDSKQGLLHYTPMVYRHPNLDGFEAIARKVAEAIPEGSKVCELYAGVGILGLTALSHKSLTWLRCSDNHAPSKRCFIRALNSMPAEVTGTTPRSQKRKNKPYNKPKNKQNDDDDDDIPLEELLQLMQDDYTPPKSRTKKNEKVTYLIASAANALQSGEALGADVLCVDPPRKGLDDTVLEQLCRPYNPNQNYAEDLDTLLSSSRVPKHAINYVNDVRTLVYVSGGFDSLARDSDRLLKGDAGWKIQSATAYLLFPGSNHVQTLTIFVR